MRKMLLCALICLMGCFFLSGCVKSPIPEPKNIMEPTAALYEGLNMLKPQKTQTQATTSAQENYCIVVDDGFGMKGFISPYCLSYRAAITALTSVTISSDSMCVRASDFTAGFTGAEQKADTFFENAVQEEFFEKQSNDIASVIENMAKNYQNNPDQVMILLSDLMIPTEDACKKAAKALQDAVIKPEHATMGIIGIVGEFRGSIENLPVSPTTGYKRKISDYMVLERDKNGNIRHPIYLLFFGDDQAVLSAMEKALSSLKSCKYLDDSTPLYSLYFSEYDIARRETDDINTKFNLGCQDYNSATYPAEFIVRGMKNDKGTISYPATTAVPDEYQMLLNKIPIAKIYDLERGNTVSNVKIRCTVPFTLTDSTQNGVIITDKHNLVMTADQLSLAPKDYSVTADIRVLEYVQPSGGTAKASWVSPDVNVIYCESAKIDESGKKIDIVLSVDTTKLGKDEPLLCQVGVRVGINPQSEETTTLYNTDWIKDLTLDLKAFDNESIRTGKTESSARFTYETTATTPFLSNLICEGIGDLQLEMVAGNIREKTTACVQTTMFGMVVRDVPGRYIGTSTWDDTENFKGWAFSVEDAVRIQAALK